MNQNPFLVKGYKSPEYFCGRKTETDKIVSAIENRRDLTIISLRRMGKTGLIHHVFNKLSAQKAYNLIYCDIYQTMNLKDFVKVLGNAVFNQLEKTPEQIFKKIKQFFSGISPSVHFNPVTLQTEIDFNIIDSRQAERSIVQIFNMLGQSKKPVVLAIDEFQQISKYPEKNIEAILRTQIQQLPDVRIIYSGSSKHVLISMFTEYNRPFYQSTELMNLDRIEKNIYTDFIRKKFESDNLFFNQDAISHLLTLTRNHTYYVQYLCNRLFGSGQKKINIEQVDAKLYQIIRENDIYYFGIRELLTGQQFLLLKAIGKEKGVMQPSSKAFIQKHNLGTTSTVNSAMSSLVKKDLVYRENGKYFIYDVFFSKWLETLI